VVGEPEAMAKFDASTFPVTWTELPALTTIDSSLRPEAPKLHERLPDNVLVRGRVVKAMYKRHSSQRM